jgi:hypothetical protein
MSKSSALRLLACRWLFMTLLAKINSAGYGVSERQLGRIVEAPIGS